MTAIDIESVKSMFVMVNLDRPTNRHRPRLVWVQDTTMVSGQACRGAWRKVFPRELAREGPGVARKTAEGGSSQIWPRPRALPLFPATPSEEISALSKDIVTVVVLWPRCCRVGARFGAWTDWLLVRRRLLKVRPRCETSG
jgi:hypothetical protein